MAGRMKISGGGVLDSVMYILICLYVQPAVHTPNITGFTTVLWPQEELSDNSPVFENSQGIQQVNAVQDTS